MRQPWTLPLLLCVFLVVPAKAEEAAARVQFVTGEVVAISTSSVARKLAKGDRIYSGETVKSGPRGSAQFIYRDRSRVALRVDTEFKIRDFSYDESSRTGKSVFDLLGGALRLVTGFIGKSNPDAVAVETGYATIGVYGTDHEVVHITPEMSQVKKIAKAGTYNKVYAGGTIMKSKSGSMKLDLHQVGFVGAAQGKSLKPVQLQQMPKTILSQIVNKVSMQARIQTGTDLQKQSSGQTSAAESAGKSPRVSANLKKGAANDKRLTTLPDVVKTPSPAGPIPIPYPNVSKSNFGSELGKTKKLNPAAAKKGVNSDRLKPSIAAGKKTPIKSFSGSKSKVKVTGKKATTILRSTGHNGSSANMPAGIQVAPSSTKIKVGP